jgi:hypothetical protein
LNYLEKAFANQRLTQSEAGRAAILVAYFHNPKKEKAKSISHM